MVVGTERGSCHGEGMAFEWLTERPEMFRVVDPNRSVLRSCGLTRRCEQFARRGDANGNGLAEVKKYFFNTWRCVGGKVGNRKPPRSRGQTLFPPPAIA